MLGFFLVASALAQLALSLKCHSCDTFIPCNRPITVECPASSSCYVFKNGNHLVAKGCAHSCERIDPEQMYDCNTCRDRDYCNGAELGANQGLTSSHHESKEVESFDPPLPNEIEPSYSYAVKVLVIFIIIFIAIGIGLFFVQRCHASNPAPETPENSQEFEMQVVRVIHKDNE